MWGSLVNWRTREIGKRPIGVGASRMGYVYQRPQVELTYLIDIKRCALWRRDLGSKWLNELQKVTEDLRRGKCLALKMSFGDAKGSDHTA